MVIYATVVSALLLVSFILNCMLIQVVTHMVKENEFLEDEIESKGDE